jgi:tetratricopeptide (TPR) repeat protein
LEQTVTRQAEFAPAWALLGYACSLQPYFSPVLREALHGRSANEVRPLVQWIRDKAETAASKALELDPTMASGYATQATLRFWRGDWAGAASLFRRALTLDPDDPDAGIEYGLMLASVGFLDQSLSIMQQVRALEPLVHTYGSFTAQLLQLSGRSAASIPILEAMPDSPSSNYRRNYLLARAYAAAGRLADAVGALRAIDETPLVTRESVEAATSVLRTAPGKAGSPQSLPRILNELNFVYAYVCRAAALSALLPGSGIRCSCPCATRSASKTMCALRDWWNTGAQRVGHRIGGQSQRPELTATLALSVI